MLFSPLDPGRQARNWEEHAAILRAIIDGDERTAATLAAEHVMRAGMDFLVGLNSGGETPLLLLAEFKNKQRGEARTARAAQPADRKRGSRSRPKPKATASPS